MARHTDNFEAALFDLDGVLTSTAAIHARNWKAVFDTLGLSEPFDIEHDYIAHVDGKVDMTHEETTYTLLEGRGLLIYDGDDEIRLLPGSELLASA
jgi:beta-phosphoglucomutase-like phosphatase (HAD superfamily)